MLMLQIHFHRRPHSSRIALQCRSPPTHHPLRMITPIYPAVLYHSFPSSSNPNDLNSLRFFQWNSGSLSSQRRAELCFFLSSNQYDLVLLQEINLSRSRIFKVSGYSVFPDDRILTHQGLVTGENQNGGDVLTVVNSDLSYQGLPL